MKLLARMKDGGPESRVFGFFFIEIKKLFSVVLLYFADGSREAFHSHAFNSLSWVLKGRLTENMLNGDINTYTPSFRPVKTLRSHFHKVVSDGGTWVLTFRGPWVDQWKEYLPATEQFLTLTHGRKVIDGPRS